MPHIILKHSTLINDHSVDYQSLFQKMSDSLASDDFCSLAAIKCYLLNSEVAYMPEKDFFVHLDLLLLERDNHDVVHEKATALRTFLKEYFSKSYSADPNAFSMEIRYMKRSDYFKGDVF